MSKKVCAALVIAIGLAGAGLAAASETTIHGTVSQGYLKSTEYNYLTPNTKDGTFAFNEGILNVSSVLGAKTRVGVQLLGRDFGAEGNNQFMLDWAFGDYRWHDYLGFRAGKIKPPLGFYNKTRDVDVVRTSVLLPQSVYDEQFRTIETGIEGASIYGNLDLASGGGLEYEVYGGTVELNSTDFLDYELTDIMSGAPLLDYAADGKQVYGGSLVWNTPVDGLRVGGTALSWKMKSVGTFANGTQMPFVLGLDLDVNSQFVLSGEYTRGDLTVSAEMTRFDVNLAVSGIPFPTGNPENPYVFITAAQKDMRGGYYLQGAYRFCPVFELGSYYSVYFPNWGNRDGEGYGHDYMAWRKDLALTARFDATDNWILKAELHLMNGTGGLSGALNPDGYEKDTWNMFAAKSTFAF